MDLFHGRLINIKNGYAELPPWPGLGLKIDEEVAKKLPPTRPKPEMYFDDGSVADH